MQRNTLALVCALSLGLALTARAGVVDIIENPGDIAACGDPAVAASMDDPAATTFVFAGPEGCEKLCKKAEKECKDFVKRVISCRIRVHDNDEAYAKKTCEVNFEGSDVGECKKAATQENKQADSNEKAMRDIQENACEIWREVCVFHCTDN